jgi:nicotinamidase-related amidase
MKQWLAVSLILSLATIVHFGQASVSNRPESFRLKVRSRVEEKADQWKVTLQSRELDPKRTAIILCDVWDKHWCAGATKRCGEIAKRIQEVVEAARAKGVFIIHAPSETMDFYAGSPARKRMQEAPTSTPPQPKTIHEAALPIDDSDGGCDDQPQCKQGKAWSRQNPVIRVAAEDGVSDNGQEVYNALRERNIDNLIVMGVHTNMCVLGRSFAIRQMSKWGVKCVLIRDCTDTMYNPRKSPFVPHAKGTELVVEHIEKYYAPTATSSDFLAAIGQPR